MIRSKSGEGDSVPWTIVSLILLLFLMFAVILMNTGFCDRIINMLYSLFGVG